MSELENCSRCGSLFVRSLRPICASCYKKQELDFKTVSSYMRQKENRMATMLDVCEHTGVEEQTLRQFIREGRLMVSAFPNLGYPCESCGKMIQLKRLCTDCQSKLDDEIASLNKKDSSKEIIGTTKAKRNQLNQFL